MNSGDKSTLLSLVKRVRTEQWIISVVVPVLLIASLFLPPASLGNRLFRWGEPRITPQDGGLIVGPYGAQLVVPANAVAKSSRLRLDAVDASALDNRVIHADFVASAAGAAQLARTKADGPEAAAMQAIPADVSAYAPLYRLTLFGESPQSARLSLPLPYELMALERADLYGWDGSAWRWLPSQRSADGLTMTADLTTLPLMVMVMEGLSGQASASLAIDVQEADALATAPGDCAVCVSGLFLSGDLGLAGETPALAGEQPLWLTISNVEAGVVRSDLVDNLLIDASARAAHIADIVARVAGGPWIGVDLDYRGVDPALREDFSRFAAELAQALTQAGKALAVRVDAPQMDGDAVDTGAYDWLALGQTVDRVRIPALVDPAAYVPGGDMDRMLTYATCTIQRLRIDLVLTTYSHDATEGAITPLTYKQALMKLASAIQPENPSPMALPGQTLRFSALDPALLAISLDEDAQTYWFRYRDENGEVHTVWLENGLSALRKAQYVSRYALGGVLLDQALHPENDPSITALVQDLQSTPMPLAPQFAYVWTVQDQSGRTVSQQVVPLDQPGFVWTASDQPGQYVIGGAVSDDGGQTTAGAALQMPVLVPSPTFTPTPTSTPTPTPTNTPTPTATPKPTTAAPAAAASAAVAAAPAPRGGAAFGYGIQAHIFGDDQRIYDHVKAIGFGWVKQQVEWFRYNPAPGQYNWGDLDRIVDGATANGLNVLFSVVKAPHWTRGNSDLSVDGPPQNPQDMANFMGAMAARYKGRVKAYEIWNEQNLHYEWGNEPIDPVRYVSLLRAVYGAIKAADPGAYVISGALTPTGAPPPVAMDDFTYLELMYQAGLKNYCDGIGAHPSGYNIPPDATYPGYQNPNASFRGPWDSPHHSWSFRTTMEGYRNIMVKYGDSGKRIWPTEFGWASVEGLGAGPAPGYGYAADNSEAQQAQYIVKAYQMARNWGWVGPMFLWNLNFAPVAGNADEKAAFGIVRADWSPRPAFHALAGMAK